MLDTLRSALQGKIDLPYRLVVSILGLVSVVFRAKPCDGIARLADWFGDSIGHGKRLPSPDG